MRIHLLIFILLALLVIFSHYLLNSIYLDYGMHSDDWISLVRYKALEVDFLEKIQIFWKRHGPHVTSQIIYMGLLESLFGLNYKIFALINITFKILATISLYPLILLLFKRKLLAFLAVVLYSLSYSTVGTFRDVHKGTEYQAIFFMNIFLIIYILLTRKQTLSLKWLLALIITFATAILLAPPRLFPLTLLPLIIELFLWLHNRTKYNLRFGLKKLFFLYLPFILLFIYHPSAIIGRFIIPITHLQKILKGYWFTILNPLSGLGYMILWDSYWIRLIGSLNIDSFKNYLLSLFSQTTFVFGLISIFLALIFTKNKMRFIVLAFILNFILGILIFFLATNHLKIPPEQRVNFDFNILYSVFVGAFVFVLSICFYVEWLLTGKKNGLLLAIWLGPLAGFYFVFSNWLFGDTFLSFAPSQQYLTVPAIGISLMISSLLTFLHDKLKAIKILNLGSGFALFTVLLIFIPIYSINRVRTTDFLSSIVRQNNAPKQQDIQQKLRSQIKESINTLVFFDWTRDKENAEFYSETIHSSFPFWMHYTNEKIAEGCIDEITDKTTLINSITEKNGKKGFLLQGVCVETPSGIFFLNQEVFYELGNFYAFEIDNNNLTDIRDKVLKDIGI